MKILWIVFFAMILQPAQPYANDLCEMAELDSLPILQGGRVKPLRIHARETLKIVVGKQQLGAEGDSKIKQYCLLSISKVQQAPLAFIEHQEVRNFLTLPPDIKHVPYPDLVEKIPQLRGEVGKIKFSNAYKKGLEKLLRQIFIYQDIINQTNWKLPRSQENTIQWVSLNEWDQSQLPLKIAEIINEYQRIEGNHYKTEILFDNIHPFSFALLFSLLGTLFALLNSKRFKTLMLGCALISVVWQIIGMTFRVIISGRAPVTNMYETVMFSGFGALILGPVIYYYKKDQRIFLISLAYNAMSLLMMHFAQNMLSPSIGPLVPSLRDNFWLSTHVTTVVLSYGAFGLSWLLANYALVKRRFGGGISQEELKHFADFIYSALKFGVVLLSAGLILGGVWAAYSWGRFWDWDPKENWSLIVLCIYMAILHGKYTKWITLERFIPITALAFLSVMMAWFGVNYILASGLHSYGFSEGGAIFLISFYAVQISLALVCMIGQNKRA